MIGDDVKKALLAKYVLETLICFVVSGFWLYHLLSKPESAMMQAVLNNDLAATRQLIHESAALNEPEPCRETHSIFTTPLIEAASLGRTQIVAELLKAGAEVNARDDLGTTPLLAALKRGHIETAFVLLDYQADPNLATCVGHGSCTTALRCARQLRVPQLVAKIESLGGKDDPGMLFSVECLWIDIKPILWFSLTRIVPVVVLVMLSGGIVRRSFGGEL